MEQLLGISLIFGVLLWGIFASNNPTLRRQTWSLIKGTVKWTLLAILIVPAVVIFASFLFGSTGVSSGRYGSNYRGDFPPQA